MHEISGPLFGEYLGKVLEKEVSRIGEGELPLASVDGDGIHADGHEKSAQPSNFPNVQARVESCEEQQRPASRPIFFHTLTASVP